VKLPIANSDGKSRVLDLEAQLQEAKKSSLPKTGFILYCLIGSLPRCVIKWILENCKSTVGSGIFSSIPAFNFEVYKFGLKQVQYYCLVGLMMENLSLGKCL